MQTLRVNNLPPTLNEIRRLHFQQVAREKKEWKHIVGWLVKEQKIKPVSGPVIVTYEFYFKDSRKHDPDNYSASAKFLQDGLVESGILSDDSFGPVVELRLKQGGIDKQPYILVKLEEVNHEPTTA